MCGLYVYRENGNMIKNFDCYDGLNENDPKRLIVSGTIRRCGFFGAGVALLEKV